MRVIDVDSHFLEPPDWLNQVDSGLAAEIPPSDPIDRVTPLVSADPLRPTLDLVPEEMLIFSSDFPHVEGRENAVSLCRDQMKDRTPEARDLFFGNSIAELLDL